MKLSFAILYLLPVLCIQIAWSDFDKLQERHGKLYIPNTDELFSGIKTAYWNSSNSSTKLLRSEEIYFDGVKHGLCKHWYSNGQKRRHEVYDKGWLVKMMEWNEMERNKTSITSEADGWRKTTEWYSDGIKCAEYVTFIEEEERIKSHPKQKWHSAKTWWRDGTPCPYTNLKNGNGVVVRYKADHSKWGSSFDGWFATYATFKNGILDGKYKKWHHINTDKAVTFEFDCEYKEGVKHGKHISYSFDRLQIYDMGNLVSSGKLRAGDKYQIKFGSEFFKKRPPFRLTTGEKGLSADLQPPETFQLSKNKPEPSKGSFSEPAKSFEEMKAELFKRYMSREINKEEYFHLYKQLMTFFGKD